MEQVSINLPEEYRKALKLPAEEIPSRLNRELAIRLYSKGLLSFGKARQLAGMTRWDFHDILGDEGVTRRYDIDELKDDLKTVEDLG